MPGNPIEKEMNRRLGIKEPGEILFGKKSTSASRPTKRPPSRPVGERADPSPELSLHSMPSLGGKRKASRSLSKGSR